MAAVKWNLHIAIRDEELWLSLDHTLQCHWPVLPHSPICGAKGCELWFAPPPLGLLLRYLKNARRCGTKYISKSKYTKYTILGLLLEVKPSWL